MLFITDVKLLRMELILARSTLARLGKARAGAREMGAVLTTFGAGGVGGAGAGVATVPEAVAAAAADGTTLGTLSVLAGAGAACLSFLSSTAAERGEQGQKGHSVPPPKVSENITSDFHRCKNILGVLGDGNYHSGTGTSLPGDSNPTAPAHSPAQALCLLHIPNEAGKDWFVL